VGGGLFRIFIVKHFTQRDSLHRRETNIKKQLAAFANKLVFHKDALWAIIISIL